MQMSRFLFGVLLFTSPAKAVAQLRLPPRTDSGARIISLRPLPQNFYKQGLPFVCRQELRLQKLTALPLCFRMGSKDYVDYLEKKPNAAKPLQ